MRLKLPEFGIWSETLYEMVQGFSERAEKDSVYSSPAFRLRFPQTASARYAT